MLSLRGRLLTQTPVILPVKLLTLPIAISVHDMRHQHLSSSEPRRICSYRALPQPLHFRKMALGLVHHEHRYSCVFSLRIESNFLQFSWSSLDGPCSLLPPSLIRVRQSRKGIHSLYAPLVQFSSIPLRARKMSVFKERNPRTCRKRREICNFSRRG